MTIPNPEHRDLLWLARMTVQRATIRLGDEIEVIIPYNVYIALEELVDAINAGTYRTKWKQVHDLRENPEDQARS
jgi:hypothetical protein